MGESDPRFAFKVVCLSIGYTWYVIRMTAESQIFICERDEREIIMSFLRSKGSRVERISAKFDG